MKKFVIPFFLGLIFANEAFPKSIDGNVGNNYSRKYEGIIANVNGKIITSLDLENRMRIALLSSGAKDSLEIRTEILKEMILEEIKRQCVSKFSPKGGWVSDEEVEKSFAAIAVRNNLDVKQFSELLKKKNINVNAFKNTIKINMSWIEYIKAKFGKHVNIPGHELNRTLKTIKEKSKQESFLVHRMFFPVTDSNNSAFVENRVNNIMKMLNQGANFEELSRQFSKSADAQNGGNLGWVFEDQISAEEFSALKVMKIGESKIIKNSRGFYILKLNDKKDSGRETVTKLKLVQVAVPRPEYANGQDTFGLLNKMKSHFTNMNDFIRQAKTIGMYVSDPISGIQEAMNAEIKNEVSKCSKGGMTKVLSNDKAFFVFCVLDKKEDKIPEPTVDDIKNQMISEKFSVFSDKELYELRQKTDLTIDKKYGKVSDFI